MRHRLVIIWLALGLMVSATPCAAISANFPSVEWLTVASPHIAIMQVESVRESTGSAGDTLHIVQLIVSEVLRGDPPRHWRMPSWLPA